MFKFINNNSISFHKCQYLKVGSKKINNNDNESVKLYRCEKCGKEKWVTEESNNN